MTTARGWSLQTRLMTTVLGIVSALLVILAVVTSTVLGRVLDSQLTQQVQNTAQRTGASIGFALNSGATDATTVLESMHGQSELLLIMRTASLSAGTLTDTGAYVSESSAEVTTLDAATVARIVAALDRIPTTDGPRSGPGEADRLGTTDVVVPGAGAYRITLAQVGDGVVVVGLPMANVTRPLNQLLWAIGIVTVGGLVLLALATVFVVRSGLRPLREVAATAERVARLQLDQGTPVIAERVDDAAVDESTEVGRVGAALNTMLDHVDASLQVRARNEELMRRFVADASHELRTPLASIRGYSELSLRAPDNPETTASALERIQAQSIRMTSLVEDLLLLARLDEGQELVHGEVDLTPLAIDAVSDARVAGREHEWAVDLEGDSILVQGDAGRLHQIVANLLANARTHTPAGTRVTLSLAREGSDAVLRVHDDGPGVDPDVQDELFERFARGDKSRARKTGGTGLGLSIAKAIAQAHGGALSVTSTPGDTTFTLRVPLLSSTADEAPPAS